MTSDVSDLSEGTMNSNESYEAFVNTHNESFDLDGDTDLGWYNPIGMVKDFHEALGHPVRYYPTKLDNNERFLRMGLIWEETEELESALQNGTAREVAKELADLLYVVYSLCIANGMWPDIEEVFCRVHASNMSKAGPDGKPIYNDKGKIMKGPNYRAPDFSDMKDLEYESA